MVLAALTLVLLARAAALPKADPITSWVMGIVAGVPLRDSFAPFWQPAPMNAWGFRPLSLVLMHGAAVLWTGGLPPGWLLAGKALGGGLVWLAAATAWLRAHDLSRVAPWAALGALALTPHQFSSWYLTELDHLGAAALLAGLTALRMGRGWPATVLAAGGIATAMLLKESSALVCLAFLGAGAAVAAHRGARTLAARYASAFGLAAAPWLALAADMVAGARTEVGRAPLVERLPLLEHNAVQFGYLATPAGAAALAAGLSRRLPASIAWGAAAVALVALPLLTVHAHYETVYFAHRWAGAALAVATLGALGVIAVDRRRSAGQATAAASVIATLVLVDVALLASSAPREDLAARLFLAAAPAILGLACEAVRAAWPDPSRGATVPIALVGVALAWGPVAHLVNGLGEWHARLPVELAGRRALASSPTAGTPVVFNHFMHAVGPADQQALGAAAGTATPYVPLPAWLIDARLPGAGYGWTGGGRSLAAQRAAGVPITVFWQATRALVPDRARPALGGDLSWTRRPFGALASGRVMEPNPDVIGDHSFIEDRHWTTWRAGPTPLEALLAAKGAATFSETARYHEVPVNLLDLPRRLAAGAPWAVPMQVEVAIWRLDGGPL